MDKPRGLEMSVSKKIALQIVHMLFYLNTQS